MLKYFVISAVALSLLGSSPASADEKITYDDHVKPIFRQKCFSCHNTNKKTADLDLSTYTNTMIGGGSGEVIIPGSADDSYLYMVMAHDTEPYMPPNSDRVADAMLDTIRKWIDGGAPENSASKVMLPEKPKVNLTVDVSADQRPPGPAAMPDVLTLQPLVHTPADDAVSALATSPWAKLVAVGGQKQVVLYHSETLEPLGVLPFPEGQPRVLKFSRTGDLLLAGGGHGAFRGLAVVWNVKTGERIIEVGDELDEVLAADISSDQTMVALGGPQKIVRVYSTDSGELLYEIEKHTDWILSVEFSPDSVLLATADRAGGLHMWEAFTGRHYLPLDAHKAAVNSVSWRIDSNLLASCSEDGSIRLWEPENGGTVKNWNAHGGGAFTVEFCRDGRLVSSGRDRVSKLWDQSGKQLRAFPRFDDLALQVTHCDESDRVIAGDWNGNIRVWNAADGQEVGSITANIPPVENRLKEAANRLKEIQLQTANFASAVASVKESLEGQQASLKQHQQSLSQSTALISSKQAELAASQKAAADETQAVSSVTASIAELNKAAGPLNDGLKELERAAAALPNDEAVKSAVDALKARIAALSETQSNANSMLESHKAQVEKLTATSDTLKKQIASATATLPALQKAVETAEAAVKASTDSLAEKNAALAAHQSQVAQQQGLVNRWQAYQELDRKLALLKERAAQRDQAQLAKLEAEAVVKETTGALSSVSEELKTAEAVIQQATLGVQALTASKQALEADLSQKTDQKQKIEVALPALREAARKVAAASETLKGDQELRQTADSLASLLGEREALATQLDEQAVKTREEMATAEAEMADLQQQIAASSEKSKSARQKMEELNAQLDPMRAAAAAAEQSFRQAEAAVEQIQNEVAAIQRRIRPETEVSQASL